MKKREVIAGEIFGRLTAVRFVRRVFSDEKNYRDIWSFRCECDPEKEIERCLRDVVVGRTQSCGCLRRETTTKRITTHGHATKNGRTRLYTIFIGIGQRCNNPNYNGYKYWGGRGIKCLWSCFEDFKRDMGPTYKPGLTIGRIDNKNGHYCKENCKWETRAEQNRNYSRNVFLTFEGKTQCVSDWAIQVGIPEHTLAKRIRDGWSTYRALKEPLNRPKTYTIGERSNTLPAWCDYYQIKATTVYRRLELGWDLFKALTTVPVSRIEGV